MAGSSNAKDKKKKGGGRTTAFAGLLAVVAVIGAWLSNCIPGFGIGADGSAEGEAQKSEQSDTPAEPEAKQAEAAKQDEGDKQSGEEDKGEAQAGEQPELAEAPSVAAAGPMMIVVDARGCTVGDGPEAKPQDCETLCKDSEQFAGVESVKLDTTEGPHKTVVTLLDCLREAKIPVAVTRDE